jgi:hypothetical protein
LWLFAGPFDVRLHRLSRCNIASSQLRDALQKLHPHSQRRVGSGVRRHSQRRQALRRNPRRSGAGQADLPVHMIRQLRARAQPALHFDVEAHGAQQPPPGVEPRARHAFVAGFAELCLKRIEHCVRIAQAANAEQHTEHPEQRVKAQRPAGIQMIDDLHEARHP